MPISGDEGPNYFVERGDEGLENWRVIGPNGLVGVYASEHEAQARADFLNEQIAEATEDDS